MPRPPIPQYVFTRRTWRGGHRPTFNYKTPTYNHLKPTNCFSEIGRKIGLNGSKVVSQRSMLVFTTVDAHVHNGRCACSQRSMRHDFLKGFTQFSQGFYSIFSRALLNFLKRFTQFSQGFRLIMSLNLKHHSFYQAIPIRGVRKIRQNVKSDNSC